MRGGAGLGNGIVGAFGMERDGGGAGGGVGVGMRTDARGTGPLRIAGWGERIREDSGNVVGFSPFLQGCVSGQGKNDDDKRALVFDDDTGDKPGKISRRRGDGTRSRPDFS